MAVQGSYPSGPSAFIELKSVGGLDTQTTGRIAAELCQLMETEADIPSSRVYLHFIEVKRSEWGWDGGLLG